jgi:hypothetical protein
MCSFASARSRKQFGKVSQWFDLPGWLHRAFLITLHSAAIRGASFRSKSIRKAPKVHLVYLVEDGHYRLLDNLVFQRSDA